MALQYSPKIVQDGLVMCLDPSQNKSYPAMDLPVKDGLALWLDASDDTTFSYSSGTSVSQWRDKSGSNFHASQATVGSQPSRSTTQNSRKTVNFDGVNDTVGIPNFISNSEMSIFVVSNCGNSLFIEHSTDVNSLDGFYLSGLGTAMIAIRRGAIISYIFNNNWLSGGYSIASGVNSTGLDLLTYKNGTQQTLTSDNRYSFANSYTTANLYIGSRSASSLWSSGPIAEIIIYNRKVTNVERNLIHTYLGQKWGISNTDRSTLNLAGGFTNPWLFGNGTTANMPQYSSYNKSFSFDGITDIITYPNALGTFASYTFSFWARRNAESKMALSSYGNSTFYWFGDNSWAYTHGGVFGEKYYNKTVSIPLGSYGHYCVTYDGATVKIYRNGVFEDSQATTGAAVFNVGLQLGKNGSSVDYMFSGDIANFLMYSRALSATEVAQNYESQKARFASYIVTNGLALNLDAGNSFSYAGSGTTWYDVSGNNYSGSLINGPTYTSDNSGAIIFDGTNDYASISSNSNFNNGNNITVEAWVLCTNWSTYTHPMIVAKGINVEWILWKSNDVGYVGKLGWRGAGTAYTTTSLPNNTWVQCVGSIGSVGQKVYLNGILESTVGNTTFTSGNVNVTIAAGLVTGSPSNLLGANVAITRIYNRQLTDAEVLQNYNATKGRFGL